MSVYPSYWVVDPFWHLGCCRNRLKEKLEKLKNDAATANDVATLKKLITDATSYSPYRRTAYDPSDPSQYTSIHGLLVDMDKKINEAGKAYAQQTEQLKAVKAELEKQQAENSDLRSKVANIQRAFNEGLASKALPAVDKSLFDAVEAMAFHLNKIQAIREQQFGPAVNDLLQYAAALR